MKLNINVKFSIYASIFVKTLGICLTVFGTLSMAHAEVNLNDSILSTVEAYYGGRGAPAGESWRVCHWNSIPPIEGLYGPLYATGAKTIPQEICMNLMRLLLVRFSTDEYFNEVNHRDGEVEYVEASDGKTDVVLAKCKTKALKEYFDIYTEKLDSQIKNIFKAQGVEAAIKELEKFLDKNVALSCKRGENA